MFKRIVLCVVMVATLGLMMVGFCGNANAENDVCLDKYSDLYWKNRYVLLAFSHEFASEFMRAGLINKTTEETQTIGHLYSSLEEAEALFSKTGCLSMSRLRTISSEMAKFNDSSVLSTKRNFDGYFFRGEELFDIKE